MVLETRNFRNKTVLKRKQAVQYLSLSLPDDGFTDDQFFEFCRKNDNLRIERTSKGEILIMALTGGKTGIRNSELNADFVIWNRKNKAGQVFDSSTGFKLPSGATYSPDLAWVSKERWESLTEQQREKHVPLCPDFVVELLSSSQDLGPMKDKLDEYIENGCQLGWLINPYNKKTYVFRPNSPMESMPFEQEITGAEVLKDFKITLSEIF